MKIYEVGPFDEGSMFYATKREAIAAAREYQEGESEPYYYVNRHDIGHLTKDVACRLASGRNYSKECVEVWPKAKP